MARYKFKVLAGKHAEGKGADLRVYRKDETIDTDYDLAKKFNGPYSNMKKFELISDSGPTAEPSKSPPNLSGSAPSAVVAAAKQGFDTINPPKPVVPEPVKTQPNPKQYDDTLESMNEVELRKFAEAEEIDLGNAKNKKDMLRAIRAATANV